MKAKTLQSKITTTNILLMTIILIITICITLNFSINIFESKLESNILNISHTISKNPMVIDSLGAKNINEELNKYIDEVLKYSEDIDIIVIADKNGKRYYHPIKENIGQVFVGGDEKEVLERNESYISEATGTLGNQKRVFTPINNSSGEVIGFVMVSTLIENIHKLKNNILQEYLVVALIVFSIGILVSIYLSKNIKKSLLGYEPDQFTKLYLQREEVLTSLEEGIVAVDRDGKIIIFNKSAINMLGINDNDNIQGNFIHNVFKDSKLLNTIKSGISEYNNEITINKSIIISDRIPIIENKNVIGAVAILRNKTEVTKLAEELTGVNQVIEALRANTHEFMNKLHVILGLIQINQVEEAKKYIVNVTEEQKSLINLIINKIKDSSIAALIIGKVSRSKEVGIKLNLASNSYLDNNNKFLDRNDLITVIGNLIENSVDAINEGSNEIKEIDLFIYNDERTLIISIDDTGKGIKDEYLDSVCQKGFSTKGDNRGRGMYLIKKIVDKNNGIIEIQSEENIGTSITVTISNKEIEYDKCTNSRR
ncbi:MAG: ATP-binding protein [Peptostreptococcaceae bacterium]